jgi:microcystin-dependent protein
MTLWKWSQTAAANATADASINWAEGQAPSSVNDSARAMMAAVSKYRDDIAGAITTAGSSTAYSISSYQGFDTLGHLHNQMIVFVPHASSTGSAGSQITLNVDGLGAKPIRFSPSVEIPSGTLVQGTPYVVTYNNTDGAFYLQGIAGNPYSIPLGAMLAYTGTTAPNSAFVLPFGQAISRTTYAAYFSLVGTIFGTGDGSTTFNIIDMRGRLPIGQDNMGGSAASRVTTAGSSIDGTTIGANGGGQNVSILQGNLPNVTLGGSVTYAANSSGISYQPGGAGATVVSAMASGGNTSATTTSVSISLGGSGTALNKMPPGIVVPYILRVI